MYHINMSGLVLTLGLMLSFFATAFVYASDEVRSDVYNLSLKEITLRGDTFSGFYYDLDNNADTEKLTIKFSNISMDRASAIICDYEDASGNRGAFYTTSAQPTEFDFSPWGQYEKIEFFGDDYFAAYDNDVAWREKYSSQVVPILYDKSTNKNLMANEQISRLLIDDDSDRYISSSRPLELEEGYELAINAIDSNGNKINVSLTKNGKFLDSKVIQLSARTADIAGQTYYYKTDLGNTKDIVSIAVHFVTAFAGNDTENEAEIDGVFQISDEPTVFLPDQVDPVSLSIEIDNKDNKISVNKDENIHLIRDIYIRTADQDVIDSKNPLRYYIYTDKQGYYELHGSIADLDVKEFNWTAANFPGFYNDLDNDIGTERIDFRLSDANYGRATLSDQTDINGNRGIVYITRAQPKDFRFNPWGSYMVIGFFGKGYFAAYDDSVGQNMQKFDEKAAYLYDKSTNRNLMANEQISEILMDKDIEQTFTSNNPLKLADGYELDIKAIDINGDKAYLELSKNGKVVDKKVIQFIASGTEINDRTYYYKANIGNTKEIVQIAVHLKGVFNSSAINMATVDGIFQISDTPLLLSTDQHFGMMSISDINPITLTIKMDNKDNYITIEKDENIYLMGDNNSDFYIRVADQDNLSKVNPLRYYIYKNVDNNWISKGWALNSIGEFDESLEAFDKAILINRNESSYYVARARVLINLGRQDESLKAFDQAIDLDPKELSYYRYKASVLSSLGRQDEAIKTYDQAIQLKPDDPDNWIAKGSALVDQGNLNESLKAFDQAINLDPKEPRYYRYKGSVLSSLGRQDEAIKTYDQAIQLKPDDPDNWIAKGSALVDQGNLNESLKAFDRAIALNPKEPIYYRYKARALSSLGRNDEALKVFDQAIPLKPDDPDSWIGKGYLLNSLGNFNESLKSFDQAIALNPKEPSYYRYKASALSSLGRNDEALKVFDQAIQLKPDDPDSLVSKGYALNGLGKFNESLEAFDQAIFLNSSEPSYYVARASALIGLGRNDEALKVFDQAIQLKPNDPDIWVAKGQLFREIGNLSESLNAFDQAIELDPKETRYYRYKANVLSSQGRWNDAIRTYDIAIQLKPDDPDIWLAKGQVFREIGNLNESLEAFDQAIKLDPKEPSYYRYKASVLASLGRQDEAMREYNMAIQRSNVIFTSGAKNEAVTKSVEAKDAIEIKGKIAETTNNSIKDTARNVESKTQPDLGGLLTTICILVAYLTFNRLDKERLN